MSELEEFEFRRRYELEQAKPPEQKVTASDLWKQELMRPFNAFNDVLGGIPRGAGSIGATLLKPTDWLNQKIGLTSQMPDRRAGMDAGLTSLGVDINSLPFKSAKLGTEIAGVSGVGPALGAGAKAIGFGGPVVSALTSSGMTTGSNASGFIPKSLDMATRMFGGGVSGGAAAGMVDPQDAGFGALIGGALPVVGAVGGGIRRILRGPEQTPELRAAIESARAEGYVIPPSQARQTLANRIMEGFSGKLTTAQNASAVNQPITARIAVAELGLPPKTVLTPDILKTIRKGAGQEYAAVSGSGIVKPGSAYDQALDAIVQPHKAAAAGFPNAPESPVIKMVDSLRSNAFDASSAVAKINELRSAADDAFRAGNSDIGRASKAATQALEDALDAHLVAAGDPQALRRFREARTLIAKTYSVEKAMNATTGTVDARKLAAQLNAGKPLSGGLKTAADFANRWPTAAKTIEGMGSLPQTSPLDWIPAGALSMATSNPLMMTGVLARPAARAGILSDFVQNRLVQPSQAGLLSDQLRPLMYRSAPLLGVD